MAKDLFYSVSDQCGESRYRFSSVMSDHIFLAEECAEDYFDCHDGWEDTWPLTFVLYESEDGPEVARFSVEREWVSRFNASEVTSDGDNS